MTDPITEIRALLMQFEKSGLKDMYIRSQDWRVFMAQPGGAVNPLQVDEAVNTVETAAPPISLTMVSAPHLGLFEPVSAAGENVTAGQIVAIIDVLGRKTEVASTCAGRVAAVRFAANDLVEFGEVLAEIEAA